ncbi:MAG: hypothetical protein ACR2H4_05385 [Pyrinomonadaceae bacterium]
MKRCPQCNRAEADDALVFCRTDGAALVRQEAVGSRQTAGDVQPSVGARVGTAQFELLDASEVHTSILPHNTDASFNRVTGATFAGTSLPATKREELSATSEVQRGKSEELSAKSTSEVHRTGRRKIIIPVAIAILVIGIVVAVYSLAGRFITPAKDKGIESVAVLPFENKSGNADSEYLSDGFSESLIYRLSQLSNLKVSPRSSVFRYKGKEIDAEKIGNELGVDAVMSGRLTQRGDNLTISVDLIDVKNKKTLWGEQFERKLSDLLSTQRDIASAITDKLQVKLSGTDSSGISKQYTSNNEAYQLYLQGRYFWNKRSSGPLKKATELLRAATEKDPNFALAYAGLADCYAVSYYYVGERPREIMPLAKTYAAKAIELDPTLAEPHATMAFVSWLLERDKAGAEKEFLRAIELNPNYPTSITGIHDIFAALDVWMMRSVKSNTADGNVAQRSALERPGAARRHQ